MSKPLASNIKIRPWPLSVLPPMKRAGTALYPNIWIGKALYEELLQPNPSPYTLSLIAHEQLHLERIRQAGVWRWYVKYVLSRRFRYQEELAGTKSQIVYLLEHGAPVDAVRFAQFLSGPTYGWQVRYDQALHDVQAIITAHRA